MSIGIRLRQYSSRVIRLSLRPWVAAGATVALLFFYLAIFNAASINVNSERPPIKLRADDGINRSSVAITNNQLGHPEGEKLQPHATHRPAFSKGGSPITNSSSSGGSYDKEYLEFLRRPVINHHNFSYIHNLPDACSEEHGVELVIVSPSGTNNFYRRMMARKSGRSLYTGTPGNRALQLFFLGSSRDREVQRKVAAEAKRYGDIVQESFVDVYANITFKAVQMLKWVSLFCSRSEYVIRLDDDVIADVAVLRRAMARTHEKHPEFILGEIKRGWPPCRIPKCLTTKEEYPYATLMPFALGGALGYPTSSVQRLYEATKRVKRFKLDDVYVTGMCAPKVGVKLLHDDEFFFKHKAW